MTRFFGRATAISILAAGLVLSPAAARAQSSSLTDIVLENLSRAWSFITGAAESAGDAVTPMPIDTLRQIRDGEGVGFWSMLEDAGYDLKEIETEVGIIPGIDAKYVLKRELSDSDREALERQLELHAEKEPGLIGKLERAIIYSLLDASELGEYRIEELKVTFLPLPAASFVLAPAEGPLSEEHDRMYRFMREQTRMIRHMDREGHKDQQSRNNSAARPANGTPR